MGADRPWPKSCLATSRPPVSLFTLPSRRNLLSRVWPPHDSSQLLVALSTSLRGPKGPRDFPQASTATGTHLPVCCLREICLEDNPESGTLEMPGKPGLIPPPGISSGLPWGRAPRGPPAYLPQRRPRRQAQFGWLHAPSPGAHLPAAAAPR